MLKALRKYNKWILGIGGSLLMVTFLMTGTSSLFQPDPNKRVLGTIGNKEVRAREMGLADREYEALKDYVPGIVNNSLNIQNGTHWLLLATEAEDAGFVGETGDALEWIPELAQSQLQLLAQQEVLEQYGQMAEQLMNNPQVLQMFVDQKMRDPQFVSSGTERLRSNFELARPQVAANKNLRLSEFDEALAKLRGVTRLISSYTGAARLSNRQAISEVRRLYDSVTIDGVIIPADRLIDEMPEPTAQQLTEQFEKYRDVRPGTGEYGFGYRQPPRVKLEWMVVSSDAVKAAIVLDPISVNKHWQQNRTLYPGEFVAERQRVEEDLRQAELATVLEEADRFVKARVRSATRRLETVGGTKKLPSDWEQLRPTMESIATALVDGMKSSTGVAIPLPTVVVKNAAWLPVSELVSEQGIGQAELRLGGRRGDLGDAISQTAELAGTSTIGLQAGVPYETALRDPQGNLYYFTVLDARQESAAESLDEVRDEVIKDVKRFAAFEKLSSEASTYHLLAVSDGLEAVGQMFSKTLPGQTEPTGPLPVFRGARMSQLRSDQTYPELEDQEFRDHVMALAAAVGPLTVPGTDNLAQRTTVATLPKSLSLAVVQLTSQQPLTQEDLRTLGKASFLSIMSRELGEAAPDQWPFSFEALKSRLAFRAVRDEDAPGDEEATPTATPVTTSPAAPSPAPSTTNAPAPGSP